MAWRRLVVLLSVMWHRLLGYRNVEMSKCPLLQGRILCKERGNTLTFLLKMMWRASITKLKSKQQTLFSICRTVPLHSSCWPVPPDCPFPLLLYHLQQMLDLTTKSREKSYNADSVNVQCKLPTVQLDCNDRCFALLFFSSTPLFFYSSNLLLWKLRMLWSLTSTTVH